MHQSHINTLNLHGGSGQTLAWVFEPTPSSCLSGSEPGQTAADTESAIYKTTVTLNRTHGCMTDRLSFRCATVSVCVCVFVSNAAEAEVTIQEDRTAGVISEENDRKQRRRWARWRPCPGEGGAAPAFTWLPRRPAL